MRQLISAKNGKTSTTYFTPDGTAQNLKSVFNAKCDVLQTEEYEDTGMNVVFGLLSKYDYQFVKTTFN